MSTLETRRRVPRPRRRGHRRRGPAPGRDRGDAGLGHLPVRARRAADQAARAAAPTTSRPGAARTPPTAPAGSRSPPEQAARVAWSNERWLAHRPRHEAAGDPDPQAARPPRPRRPARRPGRRDGPADGRGRRRDRGACPSVGRCHVGRYGDGGAHLHPFFFGRPARMPQLRGSCAPRLGGEPAPTCPRTYAVPTPATSAAASSSVSAARVRPGSSDGLSRGHDRHTCAGGGPQPVRARAASQSRRHSRTSWP